nr:hypothetical protein [Pandoravirus massiliensis]
MRARAARRKKARCGDIYNRASGRALFSTVDLFCGWSVFASPSRGPFSATRDWSARAKCDNTERPAPERKARARKGAAQKNLVRDVSASLFFFASFSLSHRPSVCSHIFLAVLSFFPPFYPPADRPSFLSFFCRVLFSSPARAVLSDEAACACVYARKVATKNSKKKTRGSTRTHKAEPTLIRHKDQRRRRKKKNFG